MRIYALGLLFPFQGLLLASTPEHLKSGALTSHLGHVALVEDVLIVRYPSVNLLSIPEDLNVVSTKLDRPWTCFARHLKMKRMHPP